MTKELTNSSMWGSIRLAPIIYIDKFHSKLVYVWHAQDRLSYAQNCAGRIHQAPKTQSEGKNIEA